MVPLGDHLRVLRVITIALNYRMSTNFIVTRVSTLGNNGDHYRV